MPAELLAVVRRDGTCIKNSNETGRTDGREFVVRNSTVQLRQVTLGGGGGQNFSVFWKPRQKCDPPPGVSRYNKEGVQ
jgi:hypothetical protein